MLARIRDRKSTRLNSSHVEISYAVFCLKKKKQVGVVPMGFADGLALLNCGAALVRGVRAPILGNLSLEHVSLDISVFFFNETGTTEIYTLSQHDALPI